MATSILELTPYQDAEEGKPEGNLGQSPSKQSLRPVVVPSPVKAYTQNMGRSRSPSLTWEPPEWDLSECGRIRDTEAYVRRAFAVKEALFLKEGYDIVGQNPNRVAYIKKRFQQIEYATNTPVKLLISRTVGDLTCCHNAFWVKKRDLKASGGKVRTVGNKEIVPIAGYFIAPPETFRFQRDEFGKIVKYRQEVYGKEPVEFFPEDVIHFYYDKYDGFAVGTHPLVPVKDDIRALRRIEENIELLYYQYLFPLFQYKVGTPEHPAETFSDGSTEIDVVRNEVENMPADGLWVTPERHEISVKGAEGKALDPKDVINHFKQRVFTGLGVSSVDMGEGGTANRSTAQTLSRNLVDRTKADQRVFEEFLNTFVIKELLEESTFPEDSLLEEENQVYIVFREIDNAAKQALENHISQMYENNLFTHDEARDIVGREPWTEEDWQKSYWRQIDEPKTLMQSIDEPYSAEAKAAARSSATSITPQDLGQEETARKQEIKLEGKVKASQKPAVGSSKKSKAGANKNKPANQHGTRSSAKLNKDFYDAYNVGSDSSMNVIFSQHPPISNAVFSLKDDIKQAVSVKGWNKTAVQNLIGISLENARIKLLDHAKRAYRLGVDDTGKPHYDINLTPMDAKIERHVVRFVNKLRDHIIAHVERNIVGGIEMSVIDAEVIGLTLDALAHRAKMIDESEVMRAYNAGLADGFKSQGIDIIDVKSTGAQPCEICNKSTLQWKSGDAIIYEELPPLHPHCMCVLTRNS